MLYIFVFLLLQCLVFLLQYFLILFSATSSIFECPSFASISLILCHNSIISSSFFIIILYCFNTTFFPCSVCSFYNHFIHTYTRTIYIFFNYIKCLMIFGCLPQLKSLAHFLIFIFSLKSKITLMDSIKFLRRSLGWIT